MKRFSTLDDWKQYSTAKKDKLSLQLNPQEDHESDIFADCVFAINSVTQPSGLELKRVITRNGGLLAAHHASADVTHVITERVSHAKQALAKSRLLVTPQWLLDSIKQKRRLPVAEYLVSGRVATMDRFLTAKRTPQSAVSLPVANICGKTEVTEVVALIEEWVLTEEDLFDEDVAHVTKFLLDLLEAKHVQQLQHVMSAWLSAVERRGHAVWKQCFESTRDLILAESGDQSATESSITLNLAPKQQ